MTSKKLGDPTNAVIILNPVSGRIEPKRKKQDILILAKKYSWKGRLVQTSLKKNATNLAEEAIKNGSTHIIVCGGDGTVMEVLGAALKKKVVIGVVPLGTWNLFVKNLDIPDNLEQAMEIAFLGKERAIDTGNANGIFFSIMAGIGLDAQIMKETSRELKNKLGIIAYMITITKKLKFSSGLFQIVIDNKKAVVHRAKSVLVANMGKITGGIQLVPKAHPQSGKLQVGIVKARNISAWFNLIANALKGDVNNSPYYTLLAGKEIYIKSLRGLMPYECDGNHFPPVQELKITIYPQSINVKVG